MDRKNTTLRPLFPDSSSSDPSDSIEPVNITEEEVGEINITENIPNAETLPSGETLANKLNDVHLEDIVQPGEDIQSEDLISSLWNSVSDVEVAQTEGDIQMVDYSIPEYGRDYESDQYPFDPLLSGCNSLRDAPTLIRGGPSGVSPPLFSERLTGADGPQPFLPTSTLKPTTIRLTESESIELFELQFGPGSFKPLPAGANAGPITTASNLDQPGESSLEILPAGATSQPTTGAAPNLDTPSLSSIEALSAGANSRPPTRSVSNLDQPGESSLETLCVGANSGSTTEAPSHLDAPVLDSRDGPIRVSPSLLSELRTGEDWPQPCLPASTLKPMTISSTESELIELFELQFGPGSLKTSLAGANTGPSTTSASNLDTPMLTPLENLSAGAYSGPTTEADSNLDTPMLTPLENLSAEAYSGPTTEADSNLDTRMLTPFENLSAEAYSGPTTEADSNLDTRMLTPFENLSAEAYSGPTTEADSNLDTPMLTPLENLSAEAYSGPTTEADSNLSKSILPPHETFSGVDNSGPTTEVASNLNTPVQTSIETLSAGANTGLTTSSASNLQPQLAKIGTIEHLSAGVNSRPIASSASNLQPQLGEIRLFKPPTQSRPKVKVLATRTRTQKRYKLGKKLPPGIPTAPGRITTPMPPVNEDQNGQQLPKFQTGCDRRSDLRRNYGDLIETCQNITEKKGVEKDLQTIMANNISEGNRLFEGLKRSGGGPGDFLMAIRHTQSCSEVLRDKVSGIGQSASEFSIDAFVKGLKEKYKNSSNVYDPRVLIENVSKQMANACVTAPYLKTAQGMFDVFDVDDKSTQKEKKQRAPRKRGDDQGPSTVTQHEEINISQMHNEAKKSSVTLKEEMLKTLQKSHDNDSRPTNLFELALDKTSFSGTVERLYNIGSLGRDGYIGVSREKPKEGEREKPGDSCLAITPAKPVRKRMEEGPGPDDTTNTGVSNNQYILSFSAARYRQLCAAAKGEDLLDVDKDKTPNPP